MRRIPSPEDIRALTQSIDVSRKDFRVKYVQVEFSPEKGFTIYIPCIFRYQETIHPDLEYIDYIIRDYRRLGWGEWPVEFEIRATLQESPKDLCYRYMRDLGSQVRLKAITNDYLDQEMKIRLTLAKINSLETDKLIIQAVYINRQPDEMISLIDATYFGERPEDGYHRTEIKYYRPHDISQINLLTRHQFDRLVERLKQEFATMEKTNG